MDSFASACPHGHQLCVCRAHLPPLRFPQDLPLDSDDCMFYALVTERAPAASPGASNSRPASSGTSQPRPTSGVAGGGGNSFDRAASESRSEKKISGGGGGGGGGGVESAEELRASIAHSLYGHNVARAVARGLLPEPEEYALVRGTARAGAGVCGWARGPGRVHMRPPSKGALARANGPDQARAELHGSQPR